MLEIKMSDAGNEKLRSVEGFRSKLYNDSAGHATIGFGHLVHKGPINGSEPEEFKKGISIDRGIELLKVDLKRFEKRLWTDYLLHNCNLNQFQIDALIMWMFNVGEQAYIDSTLRLKLFDDDFLGVLAQIARWNKQTNPKTGKKEIHVGLVNRRLEEMLWFSRKD